MVMITKQLLSLLGFYHFAMACKFAENAVANDFSNIHGINIVEPRLLCSIVSAIAILYSFSITAVAASKAQSGTGRQPDTFPDDKYYWRVHIDEWVCSKRYSYGHL